MVEVGDKIKIVAVDDNGGKDWQIREYVGRVGIVEYIDSIGQLHGTWGGLAINPNVDTIQILTK